MTYNIWGWPMSTYEETLAECRRLTDAQRSLAWSPEPPYEPLPAEDCRFGGSCGIAGIGQGETMRDRWRQARFRYLKEQKQLEKAGTQ